VVAEEAQDVPPGPQPRRHGADLRRARGTTRPGRPHAQAALCDAEDRDWPGPGEWDLAQTRCATRPLRTMMKTMLPARTWARSTWPTL